MTGPGGEMIVYATPDGGPRVQLRAVDGTVWLSQAEIAELYGTSVSNIAHIARRVLDDGEVTQATIDSELRVAQEGRRQVRREVLTGSGRVSAERMKIEVGERYVVCWTRGGGHRTVLGRGGMSVVSEGHDGHLDRPVERRRRRLARTFPSGSTFLRRCPDGQQPRGNSAVSQHDLTSVT